MFYGVVWSWFSDIFRSEALDMLRHLNAIVFASLSSTRLGNFLIDSFCHRLDDLGHHTATAIRQVQTGNLGEALATVHELVDVGQAQQRPIQEGLDEGRFLAMQMPEDLLVKGQRLSLVPYPDDGGLEGNLVHEAIHGVDSW